jgi:dephospho-CoA kinase
MVKEIYIVVKINNMIKIGLTGGISSGKTTVAKIFASHGIPVFYSDECAREAEKDVQIRKRLLDIVGEDVLVDGEIDRNKLRDIVFNNKDIIIKVNALISPYVKQSFEKFVKKHNDKNIVILESAILFEKAETDFDFIITVVADKQTRLKRTMERDGLSEEMVLAKMNNQFDDDFKIKHSDAIIINEYMPNINMDALLKKQVNLILDGLGY